MSTETKNHAGAGAAPASTEEQIASLKEQVEAQQEVISKLQGMVSEKTSAPKSSVATAEEAKKAAEEAKAAARSDKKFKVDGVDYEFKIHRFKFEGKVYTAKEAESDKELIAKLASIKSGVIGPVKGGK